MKIRKLVALAAFFGAVSSAPLAHAQFYVGGGLGSARGSFDSADFDAGTLQTQINAALTSASLPAGVAGLAGSSDENELGWKLFAGYRFNQYFGVEGSYVNFGKFKYDYSGRFLTAPMTASVEYKVYSWNLAGVARYPFGQGFSVQAKLGAAFTNAENDLSVNIAGIGTSESPSKRKTNLLWGLGAGYDFNPRLGVLLEYENFGTAGNADETGRMDVSLWSASLIYKF